MISVKKIVANKSDKLRFVVGSDIQCLSSLSDKKNFVSVDIMRAIMNFKNFRNKKYFQYYKNA